MTIPGIIPSKQVNITGMASCSIWDSSSFNNSLFESDNNINEGQNNEFDNGHFDGDVSDDINEEEEEKFGYCVERGDCRVE